MNIKPIAAIALQMILWHTTTNGSTMLHHGRGEGKISDHSQGQDFLLFEQESLIPGARRNFQFKLEGQENTVTTGEIIRMKYEADHNTGYSTGVSDGNYDPTDPRFGDYDPYDPALDSD